MSIGRDRLRSPAPAQSGRPDLAEGHPKHLPPRPSRSVLGAGWWVAKLLETDNRRSKRAPTCVPIFSPCRLYQS
eukprot:7831124-Pyramimonas_sp.AAC.1